MAAARNGQGLKRPDRSQKLASEAVTETMLLNAALAYLRRRDVSRKKLEQYLRRWAARRKEDSKVGPWIESLLERYQASGLIDERRLVQNAVERFRERGKSTRAIQARLAREGVDPEIIQEILREERNDKAEPELVAALALVRKRRLGPFRPVEERKPQLRRDLAALSRAGFDLDVAFRALGAPRDDEL